MDIALNYAQQAEQAGEIPIGAVVTLNNQIISACGNASISTKDPTAHAEIQAIRQACLQLGTPYLEQCHLVVTLEPCSMCAAAISLARIHTLWFGAYSPKTGAIDHGPRIFDQTTCHHKPYVIGGIKEQECAQLLTDFFKKQRLLNLP